MKAATLFRVLLVVGPALLREQAGWSAGVVTNCTDASLRSAMAAGGTVTFGCDGTIPLADTITVSDDTTLDATGHQVTICGNRLVRVFDVRTNVHFSIWNLTIADGNAPSGADLNSRGGAIANAGELRLFNCTFTNNSATGGNADIAWGEIPGNPGGNGAGGAVWNSGVLLAEGCTFAGNAVAGGNGGQGSNGDPLPWPNDGYPGGPGGDGAGGALFNCGTANLVNCTFAFNSAAGGAGGPGGWGYQPSPDYPPPTQAPSGAAGMSIGGICDVSGDCHLTNCTVVFNSGTGVSTTTAAGAKLINTLLSQNSPGGNASGTVTDLGHNLSSDATCAFTNAGSLNNTYAPLGPLDDNGGPTLTIALLSGCAAIDAGDTSAAPATDQRGFARPFGPAADIGAYEYDGATNAEPSTVVTECTEAQLRGAIAGGGRVTFACDGTVTVGNVIVVTANTLLDAAGHQITIRGGGDRLFHVNASVTFSLANLTIAGGDAQEGGAIYNGGGLVNATNCVFTGNVAALGGAIENEAGAAILSRCVFTNNHALGSHGFILFNGTIGGGALDNSGTMAVDLCTFDGNSAIGNGGLPGDFYGRGGGPASDAAGGAIRNSGTLTISRCTFANNEAGGGTGGAGYVGFHGDMWMDGGAGGGGGAGGIGRGSALYNSGTARVIASTFSFNSANGGSGGTGGAGGPSYGWASGGPGGAGGSGGAGCGTLFNAGILQIINSTFASNLNSGGAGGSAGNGGNGLYGGDGGPGGNGGTGMGVLDDESVPSGSKLTNCTFAVNSGVGGGGGAGGNCGFGSYSNGDVGVAGAAGTGTGGIKCVRAGIVNTILDRNAGANCDGRLDDFGHNVSSDGSCGFTNIGSLNGVDPKLGPLSDNGGATFTMALLPGSPAIDAGDDAAAPSEDQRGWLRPFGAGTDIGAFESGPPVLLKIAHCSTGGVEVIVLGKRSQTCCLMTAESLSDWKCVVTNQFNSEGTWSFRSPAGQARMFYRVFLP